MTPTKKLSMSVTEVMVIDTAASLKVSLILSGTLACKEVRRHAPSMKDFHVVGKKMTKNGQKMAIFESSIFRIFSSKIEKSGNRKNCVL